jgi:hypothetical protein
MQSIVELIVALGQWLRSTPVNGIALWIQKTPASKFVDEHSWAVPTLQSIHILALSMLFGSVLMINLRIFGLAGRSRTMTQTAQRFMPVVWWALLIMVITGIGLILGDVVRNLTNPIFWGKMILIVVAALLSLWFQSSVHRNVAFWETTHDWRVAIRVAAAGAIVLWCLIMVAGRWIAYVPT